MTVDECLAALKQVGNGGVCIINTDSALSTAVSVFAILSSIAIIVTAIFAFYQLKHLRVQVVNSKDGVIRQIDTTQKTAFEQVTAMRDGGRLSATLNILMHMHSDQNWRENRTKFISLRNSKDGLKKFANETCDESTIIRFQLNFYELVALGIKKGILDEEMFKLYYRGTVLKDWKASQEFIENERDKSHYKEYWVELEALAKRFSDS
ncbi:DUF4760 domain-containing protein [Xanthobacter variabilis]|uniref:DUF4760 domain-containing protein n=1 Tax=Xanthobacter variabilis TaxID=3119932 RepID=UPI00374FA4C6